MARDAPASSDTVGVVAEDDRRALCVIQLDGVLRVLLWESDPDRIVLDGDGYIVSFPDEATAREDAALHGWPVRDEVPTLYELDGIERWCKSAETSFEWRLPLNAWNLFLDLDVGEKLFRAADRRLLAAGTYDKLFQACNLPSTTPEGQHYVPIWNAGELAGLRQLLLLGLAELRAHLRD
jgi:hypothetical protein